MKVLKQKNVKITPHKSIYRKIGSSGHSFNESIAEFVDNAIDARTEEQLVGGKNLTVWIDFDYKAGEVTIRDTAAGMNEEEATDAIVLASSKKKQKLGEYGLGLKTAALSIGKTFEVITSKTENDLAYNFRFNEDEWESNPDLGWEKFPFNEVEKDKVGDHGTNLKITDLKQKISPMKVSLLKKDLGKRYGSFILSKELMLLVNGSACKPEQIDWSESWPKDFEITDKKARIIKGTIGLMKESSQKGYYGFDLYKGKRLVRPYEKFGFPAHATTARIRGTVNLDHVPWTHEKNKFIEGSEEYEMAEEACRESDIFKEVVRLARKTSTAETITPRIMEQTKKWEDYLAMAFRDPELKPLVNPNVGKENKPKPEGEKEEQVDVEKREPGQEKGSITPNKEPKFKRTPKVTHEITRHTLQIGDKTFKFKHEYKHLGTTQTRKAKEQKEEIEIYTNIDFPAYSATDDKAFYAAFNIAEALSEIVMEENKYSYERTMEIKDLALMKASEIKNQYKEATSDIQKTEKKERVCVSCGASLEQYKSDKVKYCLDCANEQVAKKAKEYYDRPEVKEKQKAYMKKYYEKKAETKQAEKKKDKEDAELKKEEAFKNYLEKLQKNQSDKD